MKDEQMDDLLRSGMEMPPLLASQIRAGILRDTQPVKPMMRGVISSLAVIGICTMVALLFAALLGFKGWQALRPAAAVEMATALAISALLAGAMVSRAMRPGSGNLHAIVVGLIIAVTFEGLVFGLFDDYSTARFLQHGLICLAVGLVCALVAAVPVWLVVRRGFIVEPMHAGMVMALMCGLAGLTALTLHCDVLSVPHVGVWHAGVLAICVLFGALAGRLSATRLH